jgi:hypothetical protein
MQKAKFYLKITRRAESVAQVVENLPSKSGTLNSHFSTAKKRKPFKYK